MKQVVGPVLALGFIAAALGSSACAEVYVPRPSGAVTITSNGGSGYRVFKNGEDLGSEWAVSDAVAGDPKAEAQADQANSDRVGSIISGIGGAVAVGVGAGLLGYDGYNSTNNGNTFSNGLADASIGLLVGGIVLYVVAGALQGAAHTHMFNAVNIYNDDLAMRGTPGPAAGGPANRPILVPPPGARLVPPRGEQEVLISPGPGYAAVPASPPAQPLLLPPTAPASQ